MTGVGFLDRLARDLSGDDAAEVISFRALEDLSLGDVCTDHFIRLGGELKEDPAGLAGRAIERLDPDVAARVRVEQGYLNVTLPEDDLAAITAPLAVGPQEHEVIVPPRSRSLDRLAHLRLFSIAALQSFALHLLGRRVTLTVGDKRFEGACTSLDSLIRFGTAAPEATGWSPAPRLASDGASATIWLAPDQLTPGCVNEFFSRSSSLRDRVRFRAPPSFWLRTREESDDLPQIDQWSEAEVSALGLLLASPDSADELDLAVPKCNEGANLIWFASTLVDRIRRLSQENPFEVTIAEACSSTARHTLARLALYPSHVTQCAASGDSVALVAVTADLLARISRLVNDPALRLRHAQRVLGTWEAWILRRFLTIAESEPFLSRIVSIARPR